MVFVEPPSRPDFWEISYIPTSLFPCHIIQTCQKVIGSRVVAIPSNPWNNLLPKKTWNKPEKNTPESSKNIKMLRKFLAFLGLAMPQERQKMLSAKGVSPRVNANRESPMPSGRCCLNILFLVGGGKVVLGRFLHRHFFHDWKVAQPTFTLESLLVETNGKTCLVKRAR